MLRIAAWIGIVAFVIGIGWAVNGWLDNHYAGPVRI